VTFAPNRSNNFGAILPAIPLPASITILRVSALKEGLKSTGCHVVDIGMVPTPLVYYATYSKANLTSETTRSI
jgi:hypothetical protein